MAIKPIETNYRGYRCRSRLEARWMVFFDTIGLEFEYEPEGYDLGVLGWYLPDFYFPKLGVFGEVKPDLDLPELTPAIEKCKALTALTHKACLFLFGLPAHDCVFASSPDYDCDPSGVWGFTGEVHIVSTSLSFHEDFKYCWESYVDPLDSSHFPGQHFPYQHSYYGDDDPRIGAGVLAARSARFEHGTKRVASYNF